MNIKIVSDGTPMGTKVYASNTELQGIEKIHWYLDAQDDIARAEITFLVPDIDAVGVVSDGR